MKTMNAIERVETVLQGGIPDRVPVDFHDFMVAAQRSGAPFPEYFRSGEAMAEGQIANWREFGQDVVLVENGTAALAQACGVGVEYMEDTAPVSFVPAIESLDEVDKLVCPIPTRPRPWPRTSRPRASWSRRSAGRPSSSAGPTRAPSRWPR